MHTPM